MAAGHPRRRRRRGRGEGEGTCRARRTNVLLINRDHSAIAGCRKRRVRIAPEAHYGLSRPLNGDGRFSTAPLIRRAFLLAQPRFGPQPLPMRDGEDPPRRERIAASLTPGYGPTACR